MAIDLGGEENDVLTQFKQEGLVPGMYHDEFDAGVSDSKYICETFWNVADYSPDEAISCREGCWGTIL